MRTSKKVSEWIQSGTGSVDGSVVNSAYDSDDSDAPDSIARERKSKGNALPDHNQDWSAWFEVAERRIRSSSTKVRIDFLSGNLKSVVKEQDLDSSKRVEILSILLPSATNYSDKHSRTISQTVLRDLIASDESSSSSSNAPTGAVIKYSIGWVKKEVDRVCKPTSSASTSLRGSLLAWLTIIYDSLCSLSNKEDPKAPTTSPCWEPLVATFAAAFDSVVQDVASKSLVKKNSLTLVRRSVRENQAQIPSLIESLLKTSGTAAAPRSLALLGLTLDVSLRLRAGSEPVKGLENGIGRGYIRSYKSQILQFYTTNIVSSKTQISDSSALSDFIKAEVTEEDVTQLVRPAMEKMLLRSPEIVIPIISSFFTSYSQDVSPHLIALQTQIMSASRSSLPATREKAVRLVQTLLQKQVSTEAVKSLSTEAISALKGGKATTPEQRAALFEILSFVYPSEEVSSSCVDGVVAMLPKESAEVSMQAAGAALRRHLAWCLRNDKSPSAAVAQAVSKELVNAKVPLRKAMCDAIGGMLWDLSEESDATPAAKAFGEALLPSLETNLKTAATNTLTNPAGPLEGYVAAAVIEGRLSSWGIKKASDLVSSNPTLQALLAVSPKPSFLLWDKVYRKLSTSTEETWLLRALESVFSSRTKALETSPPVQESVGLAFVHCSLLSSSPQSRQAALNIVSSVSKKHPLLMYKIIRQGLLSWLASKDAPAANAKPLAEGEEVAAPKKYGRSIRQLLQAVVSFPEGYEQASKEDALVDLLVLAHHPELEDKDRQCFIDLCQRANVDPKALVDGRLDDLLEATRAALLVPNQAEAAYPSFSSLAFISPEVVIPKLFSSIEADLGAYELSCLSQDDLGMWRTEPGTLFVDVLAAKKDTVIDKNRKDASIEQWEAELRESIAKKKAAATKSLTKEQKIAVDAQLKVESEVRSKVNEQQARTRRALKTIISLLNARTEELDSYLLRLTKLVLEVLQVPQAIILNEKEAKAAYNSIEKCLSPRLEEFRLFAGVALLRSINEEVVEEDFKLEPLNELVLRVLYRLHSLSEQEALDLGTLAIVAPLLSQIINSGGIGLSNDDSDGTMEQIQLALDIIVFHGAACEDLRFPRADFIDGLVRIVAKHTQLAKDAVSALRSLGEAMRTNATAQEIQSLLVHLLADEVYVRAGCLQALQPLDLTDLEFCSELWLACHDEDDENTRLAAKAWEENGLDVPEKAFHSLIPLLEHSNNYVRLSCGRAIAAATSIHPESISEVIKELSALYILRNKVLAPEFDRYGLVIESTLNREDPWRIRSAVALTFQNLAQLFQGSDIVPFFQFLIDGQALGDRHEDVRQKMLDAGSAVVDQHGKEKLTELIEMFENYFSNPVAPSDANDGVTEAVVILFGRLARHLAPEDKRISQVVDRLVGALATPSELVQAAVADCLPPLVSAISKDVPRLMESLFDQLLRGAKYAERRGAAYGLAGFIQGRGLSSISEFRIMARLAEAVEDKKDTQSRQGAMFAYETFITTLQRLFEPYVMNILPQLLTCFGDASADVREATQDTAKAIMQNISGFGVKLILPTLLFGLEEKQWRTKKGAIDLLGAMAYCAPRQLSASLPTVIPRLSDVLTDSHTQVRTAANKSLKQFGEVISNPEIKDLTPTLLQALIDPNTKTAGALSKLLETSFVHYIDSPSLALIVPIIDRGLRERSAQTSSNAARIVGNLAGLTDSKDFIPYLHELIPQVKGVLVSPVPEARAVAAKALGTLVERLGEIHFADLVPSLLSVLRTDSTGVDRQGSAQGLAEILAGLGVERMEALLPEIINSAHSPRSYVREGHISLLIYLPATFGHRFSPHLGRIIPPILGGIADETESVREASMRAGRMIIANYSSKAVDLLLPELEKGMFDESWRIRMSSIQLVADLLFRLSGISGKNEVEDEEGAEAEENAVANSSVQKALVEALGQERRDRILAGLYIVRQDPNIPVRQAAIQTWKALVHNTPRTAREVLPTMLEILIKSLASTGEEQREMAARTLGELVRKLGEKILRETIPILRVTGVESVEATTRSGVCFAVSEILESATKTQLEDHEDSVIAIIRHALVDESSIVRHAAAQAFDTAQQYIGPRAIEETIPTLLGALKDPESGGSQTALAALREVMRARGDVVFPVVVPTLTAQPITAFNARALSALVKVAGEALNRKLSNILGAISKSLQTEKDEDVRSALEESVSAILSSISDIDGLHQLMVLLLGWAGTADKPVLRASGCDFFAKFCAVKKSSISITDYSVDWIRKLVTLFDDPNEEVVAQAWNALDALLKTVPKDELEGLVVPLRRAVESTGMAGRDLPGFCRPKGVGPFVPVFLAGLMNGTAEQREQGALGISDLVERTSAEAIKPFVTSMVGPLIRACGDRHAPAVKAGILIALTTMLVRIPQHCRPFYPQLQRSFQKAVSDPASNNVRTRAGSALATLIALQTRVDPVILELVQGVRNGMEESGQASGHGAGADSIDLAESSALTLAKVCISAPIKNVSESTKDAIRVLLQDAFDSPPSRENFKKAIAQVGASFFEIDHENSETVRFVSERVVAGPPEDAAICSMTISSIMEKDETATLLYGLGSKVVLRAARLVGGWIGDNPTIARPARESRERMRESEVWKYDQKAMELL